MISNYSSLKVLDYGLFVSVLMQATFGTKSLSPVLDLGDDLKVPSLDIVSDLGNDVLIAIHTFVVCERNT